MRSNGRTSEQLRPMNLTINTNKYAEGSVLIEVGDTKVICTATVEERVPPFMKGQGKGWVTAGTPCSRELRTLVTSVKRIAAN